MLQSKAYKIPYFSVYIPNRKKQVFLRGNIIWLVEAASRCFLCRKDEPFQILGNIKKRNSHWKKRTQMLGIDWLLIKQVGRKTNFDRLV